nr:MAG TPA: hypothetical protein [Caudoviricetes sp.]
MILIVNTIFKKIKKDNRFVYYLFLIKIYE